MSTLPYSYVESLASAQTKEFFRPKTFFEKVLLILLLSWFIIAFLASLDLQAYLFFLLVFVFLINEAYVIVVNKPGSPFLSTVLKFTFFFFIWLLLSNPSSSHSITLSSMTINDILMVQETLLSVLIIVGLLFKYIRFELLKPSSKDKIFENYLDFVFQLFKGISYGLFLYLFFDLVNWVPGLASSNTKFPNTQDFVVLVASILLLVSSQGPEGKDLKNIFAKELFLISETRFERLRDAILKTSIFLLFLLKLVPLFTTTHETLISAKPWTDTATLLLVIGIITFFLAFFEPKENQKSSFSKYSDALSSKVAEIMPEKLATFNDSIQDASINTDTQQFFKLTDDFPLINKENTKFVAKKNSIAIPVKETPEGTAVIFVGEGDVENINSKGIATKESLDELATAVMIPNDVWNKANLALEVIKPSDETIHALALKGIESKEKLLSLAQNSLIEFKNMANSQLITKPFQGMADNFRQGKYFVSDTAKGTFIRLPGITVIDNPETTFVRVFGIKVLESQGYTVVNMPFVKVIETPDYECVTLPGINVIEAGKSNLVNLMGFQILDGDPKEIQAARQKILTESSQLDGAFNQLDKQVENILSNPDSFLVASTGSGKKIELLTAANSSSALIKSNLLPAPVKSKGKRVKVEVNSRENHRSKIKADKTITSKDLETNLPSAANHSDFSDDYETPENLSPEVEKIDKFYRIAKMSHKSIDLKRLATLLDFPNVEELEKWLVDLNIPKMQIDWEENKILIDNDVIHGIKRVLRRSH